MNRNEEWGQDEKGGWLGRNGAVDDEVPQEHSPLMISSPTGHRRTQSQYQGRGGRRMPTHRRVRTSMRDLFSSIGASLGSIAEEVGEEAVVVRHTFQHELQAADRGRKYFLDMSLSRTMSVLPEQLTDLLEEIIGKPSEEEEEEEAEVPLIPPTPAPPGIWPYLSLLGAVLAVSSNGTAVSLLHNVSPPLKFFWRVTATALVFGALAFRTVGQRGWPQLHFSQWLVFLAAALCWAIVGLLVIYAFNFTSIGNVVIGANSQAMFLLLGKVLVGERLHWMEAGGVFLAFAGCILCTTDEAKDPDQEADSSTLALWGDVMALAAGFCGVGYLTFAKAVRTHLPVFVFMFLVMVVGCIVGLIFLLVVEGDHITWNFDPHTGLFGWMTLQENRVYVLVYMGVVVHMVGSAGFVRAMEFFDNIVIAVATLLEPITATLIAYILGVGQLPGFLGWIGNVLVVVGTLGVVYPSVNKGSGGH